MGIDWIDRRIWYCLIGFVVCLILMCLIYLVLVWYLYDCSNESIDILVNCLCEGLMEVCWDLGMGVVVVGVGVLL